jgi:hypothetical protein
MMLSVSPALRSGTRRRRGHDNRSTSSSFTPEGWQEIYKGMDPAAAAHTLAGKGMLMTDKAGKPYVREYLPGMGRRRCYRPVPKFFQMGEE